MNINTKWIKMVATLIVLLFTLCLSLQIVSADDVICDGLMSLHSKYGSELESYLNDAGKDCLVARMLCDPAIGTLDFERSFVGTQQTQVALNLCPGIYRFDLRIPVYNSDRAGNIRYITLSDVVETPENCIKTDAYSTIYFPTQIRIDVNCKVSATLGEMGSSSHQKYKVSISRISPRLSPRKAQRWTQSGIGSDYNTVEIVFSPGSYSLNIHEPGAGDWGTIGLDDIVSDPPGCFGSSWINFPSQVHISQDCRIYTTLNTYLKDNHLLFWNVSINKLN